MKIELSIKNIIKKSLEIFANLNDFVKYFFSEEQGTAHKTIENHLDIFTPNQ